MRVLTAFILMAVGTLTPASSQTTTPPDGNLRLLSDEVPDSCPVTKPSDPPFIPPAPYPSAGSSWIGTANLWTTVPENVAWALGHYTPDDSRFRQKLFWWHEGYDFRIENPAELTVTGERLDAYALPIATDEHANNGWTDDSKHPFMVVGIFIPTGGCWKITGHYKNEELSYVVWVGDSRRVDTGCSPNDLLAALKPDNPAYADAMNLVETLQVHSFVVRCVLQSTMIHVFDGQKGAALFRTDHGDFEALFLPNTETFDSVETIESREDGRFFYSFRGNPRPTSPHPLDSAYPMFFGNHANQLFITSDSLLAASITKAVS